MIDPGLDPIYLWSCYVKLVKVKITEQWKNFPANNYFIDVMNYSVYNYALHMSLNKVAPLLMQPILWHNTIENIGKIK